MEAHTEAIVKSLIAVAWADGDLGASEQEVLEGLIAAFGLADSDAEHLRAFGKTPKTLADVPLTELSADDRRTLLQQAVLITYADGTQCQAEKTLLDELARTLRIPDAEAKDILAAGDRQAARWLGSL